MTCTAVIFPFIHRSVISNLLDGSDGFGIRLAKIDSILSSEFRALLGLYRHRFLVTSVAYCCLTFALQCKILKMLETAGLFDYWYAATM